MYTSHGCETLCIFSQQNGQTSFSHFPFQADKFFQVHNFIPSYSFEILFPCLYFNSINCLFLKPVSLWVLRVCFLCTLMSRKVLYLFKRIGIFVFCETIVFEKWKRLENILPKRSSKSVIFQLKVSPLLYSSRHARTIGHVVPLV